MGGFYRAPKHHELLGLKEDLEWGLKAAIDTVAWTAGLAFPDFAPDYEHVALCHSDEYPMNEGRVVSSKGLDIQMEAFEAHFIEEHVAHSNALHARLANGGSYQVGPLARINLNLDKLSPKAKEAIAEALKINPENRAALMLRDLIEREEEKESSKKAHGEAPFRPGHDR